MQGPTEVPCSASCSCLEGPLNTHSVRVRDAVDEIVAVIAHQERSVAGHGRPDRACPCIAVVRDEPDEEVVVLAGRYAVLHANADDLVTGTKGSVPGAV